MKIEYRCQRHLSDSIMNCLNIYLTSHRICFDIVPSDAAVMCRPLMLSNICNIKASFGDLCDANQQLGIGLGEEYIFLKKEAELFTDHFQDLKLQCDPYDNEIKNTQVSPI
ncbi:unnamed protein product, partial [Leptidea sinapis]